MDLCDFAVGEELLFNVYISVEGHTPYSYLFSMPDFLSTENKNTLQTTRQY